ncbi:conjugal transfer protein TraB [Streptomyces parvulus]|uniref:conjugal transfer protein TraB n=1 Tax=Streptomyces parvulus TaxID=146923 RepID=UPI00369A1BC9
MTIGMEGDSNGYLALVAKFRALRKAASGLMEESERLAQRMRGNANTAIQLADLSAAAQVDAQHVTTIEDIAAAFGSVAGRCTRLVGAADVMHTAAGHLHHEHQAEYGGIHAAVTSSRARQAKPGFYQQN